jgi:hypothetical protein
MYIGFVRRGYDAVVAYLQMRYRLDGCWCSLLQLIIIIILTRGTLMGGINLAGLTSDMFFLSVILSDRWLHNISPPRIAFLFIKESTITQVLSCTLHMLETVTCIATGFWLVWVSQFCTEKLGIMDGSLGGDGVQFIACKACSSVCKRGENKIKRVRVVFKTREGEETLRNLCLHACADWLVCTTNFVQDVGTGEANLYEKSFCYLLVLRFCI